VSPLAWVITRLIAGYRRFLSPLLGARCRYHPTCSEYALIAVERFGAIKGSWMAIKRVGRCHPWHEGGIDPVPDKRVA
jgi:uncharacterized protein